jgi:hypothetical protein
MELTKIELTNEEAKQFLAFRQYQDLFTTLLKNGVFNTRNGQAILNFDANGTLTQIDLNMVMFKKGYPLLHVWQI